MGYGEQQYRTLSANEYYDYNCLQYALRCINQTLVSGWAYQFNEYADLWENETLVLSDEYTSLYATVSNQLSARCKNDFEGLLANRLHITFELESSFYGNGESRPLDVNQYRVVLRTGIHLFPPEIGECMFSDYHFWYQTKDGRWANKHGDTAPELLSVGTTPFSSSTSGWDLSGYTNFYNSQVYCYIITVS